MNKKKRDFPLMYFTDMENLNCRIVVKRKKNPTILYLFYFVVVVVASTLILQ